MSQFGDLTIHLCHELEIIAFTNVTLSELLVGNSSMSIIEKVFPLSKPSNLLDGNLERIDSNDGLVPGLGLSMALSLDDPSKHDAYNDKSKIAPINHELNSTNLRNKPELVPIKAPESPRNKNHWRQFRFSIELRSIRKSNVESENVFLKYHYASIGALNPVITEPPVKLLKNEVAEQLLPHSFTAFEFVMSHRKLSKLIETNPLIVEIWKKKENDINTTILMGTCSIDVSRILESPKSHEEHFGQHEYIQTLDIVSPIIPDSVKFGTDNLGELHVILALEDLGNVVGVPNGLTDDETSHNQHINFRKYPPIPHLAPDNIYAASVADTSIHDTPEYKVALDLETWKQEEEKKFRAELEEKEQLICKKLAAEFKARELAREKTLRANVEHYKNLESQLRDLYSQLEKREQSLIEAESLFETRRLTLESECQKTITEHRDSIRRLTDDFAYRLESERVKAIQALESAKKNENEKDLIQKQFKSLENEYFEFRKQTHTGEAFKLSAQLSQAITKNSELVTTLEARNVKLASTKSKLAKLHQAYTNLKARLELEQKQKFKSQTKEILGLQKRLEAANQLASVKNDKNSLSELKTDLDDLKENVVGNKNDQLESLRSPLSFENQRQIEHLKREKSTLLNTGIHIWTHVLGVYNEQDALICEIDARINSLLVN